MNTIKAEEGKWLYNGSVFAKAVSTAGDASAWREVTEAEKAAIEAEQPEEPLAVEQTIEERIVALERQNAELRATVTELRNELGKQMQTKEGSGTAFDPYKTWKPGTEVHVGEWWQTEDDYIWEAIADGIPASSTDREYWDVVGM